MEIVDIPIPHKEDKSPKLPVQKIKCTKELNLSPYIKQSNSNSDIKRILRSKFNENQINLIYNKIITRFCKK